MSTTSDIAAADDRTTAQFFFDVGYFAAWSDAYMQNGKKAAFTISDGDLDRAWAIAPEAHDDSEEWDLHMAATHAGWQPIDTMPLWAVGVVTDGERAAVSQKADNDYGDTYFAIDPEDGLDWEPTHWMPLPSAPSQIEEG